MANRFANLEGSKKISEDFNNINIGFDRVQAEMDTKGTPADAQAKADAAKAAAIAAAAADLAAHKARGADEHPTAKGNAAGFMSAADKLIVDGRTSAATPDTLMQRDAAGRAKVAAPAATDDIARKAETDAVQANLDSHATDANIHVSAADHTKLNGIAAGAEVNQNAFAVINDVEASSKSDTVIFVGGTGITVTTDPEGKRIVLTATGEATPGAHASSHITGGTDIIPNAVTGGSSGLMSGADAKFVRQDGESKTGAQAKADAAEQAAKEYTDGKVAEIVIDDASLTQKGIVQLSSATGSDSEVEAATPKAVNTVRQLAVSQIGDLAELQTTDKDNLVDALNEVFTHVDEGKELVKTAVIVKGGTVAGTSPHSFQQLADGIDTIETSTVINGQQQVTRTYAETIAANDPVYTLTTLTSENILSEIPTPLPRGTIFSPDGQYLVMCLNAGPYLYIYKKIGNQYVKMTNPTVMPSGSAYQPSFSPDGQILVVPFSASPYVMFYKRSGDTFTKLSDPSILPPNAAFGSAFSPDGQTVVLPHSTTPFFTRYRRSGDTFTKLPDPASLPASTCNGAAFSSDSVCLAIASQAAPYVLIYKQSGDTLTKLPNPASVPNGVGYCVRFSPVDQILVFGGSGTNGNLILYSYSGDTFTRLPDPLGVSTSTVYGIDFRPGDGLYLAASISNQPYLNVFVRRDDVFEKIPDPVVLPSGAGYSVRFTPDKQFLLVGIFGGSQSALTYRCNYDQVIKSGNKINQLLRGISGIGYALESGQAGDAKDIITIWR